jgi:hypothetical protein
MDKEMSHGSQQIFLNERFQRNSSIGCISSESLGFDKESSIVVGYTEFCNWNSLVFFLLGVEKENRRLRKGDKWSKFPLIKRI